MKYYNDADIQSTINVAKRYYAHPLLFMPNIIPSYCNVCQSIIVCFCVFGNNSGGHKLFKKIRDFSYHNLSHFEN